jgi:hypothetical protein
VLGLSLTTQNIEYDDPAVFGAPNTAGVVS